MAKCNMQLTPLSFKGLKINNRSFPTKEHHCPLVGTKLYCLVTEAHV